MMKKIKKGYKKGDSIDKHNLTPLEELLIKKKKLDLQIKQRWNLDKIKMIEGLLFISMLPLHKDDLERQFAFYGIGIQRLNEIVGNVS